MLWMVQGRAMHYLVKPYPENEISDLIDEVLSRIPDSGKYIDIKVNGSNVQVPFRHIIYAEHFSHMIHIHTPAAKTDHPPVLRSLYCIPENGSKILSLQQRRCDQSGACC